MYEGEKFNSITHLLGVIFAVAAASILITMAALKADAHRIVGFSIYGGMMVILYTASTLFHSFKDGKVKDFFQQADHVSIYLMIAGTYTPFTLIAMKGALGWTILAVIWGLAILGIVQEFLLAHRTRKLSFALYLIMGWLVVVTLKPLAEALPWMAIFWIVLGGLLYTIGFFFYLYDDKIKHGHGIWHLFVLGGTISHFASLVGYLA